MQKRKRSKTNYRYVAVFFCSLVITLVLGISARFLVSYRIYKTLSQSATKICALWSDFFSKYAFASIKSPPTLALDAELYSKSDFSDVKLNMSFNPIDSKIAASLYANCADGSSKELYAFVDKSSAGFSFGEQSNKFYTIPSKTFAQGVGMLGTLVNNHSYSIDTQKYKTIYTMLMSQRNSNFFENDKIRKRLLSLACTTNFSALGNDKYKFKIKTSDLCDIVNAVVPQSYQAFCSACDSNSFFTFVTHMRGRNLQRIECITPAMSGRVYFVGIDFTNEFRNFEFCISELVSAQKILNVNTSLNDKQIFLELDFNSGEFDMRAVYDISQSEIYSQFSAGKYQNIVARGCKDKNSYILTVVCAGSSKDRVLNLKFLQDISPERKSFTNISTNKVTFGEIMKLQKELSFFCNLYTKQ